MKRFILFCFMALSATIGTSAGTTMMKCVAPDNTPGEDPDYKGNPHKAPSRILTCFCQDNFIIISSPYIIEEAEIIIYDENNNAIYSFTTTLTNSNNIFVLPQYVVENKYRIEIAYENNNIIRFFE